MADEAPKPDITQDDFLAFLRDRQAQVSCPSCTRNTWSVILQHEVQGGIIPMLPFVHVGGGFMVPPPNVPVIAMICNHCSFVRLHARSVVIDWKKTKQKPDG